jgi:phage/plasmid-associated DNA primase
LNLAIEGFHDWKESALKRPAVIEQEYREYRCQSDTVSGFIDACCLKSGRSPTINLFIEYEKWCHSSGLTPLSSSMFGKALGQKGYKRFRASKGNGWEGLTVISRLSNDNSATRFAA